MLTHVLAFCLVHDQSIGKRVWAIISSFTCRIIASVQCIYWDQLMLARCCRLRSFVYFIFTLSSTPPPNKSKHNSYTEHTSFVWTLLINCFCYTAQPAHAEHVSIGYNVIVVYAKKPCNECAQRFERNLKVIVLRHQCCCTWSPHTKTNWDTIQFMRSILIFCILAIIGWDSFSPRICWSNRADIFISLAFRVCKMLLGAEYTLLNAFYCCLFAFMICRWQFAVLPTVSKSIDFNRHHLRNGWHYAIPFSHSFVIVRKIHIAISESYWNLFVRLKIKILFRSRFVRKNKYIRELSNTI